MGNKADRKAERLSHSVHHQAYGQSRNHWLLYSLALAIVPALGYALAFVHELEFCNVFGLPKEFIVLNWTNIIITIGSFVGFSFILFFTANIPYLLLRIGFLKMLGPIKRRIIKHLVVLLMMSLIFVRYSEFVPDLVLIYLFPPYFMLIDFVFPLLTQRSIHGYRNKLEAEDKRAPQLPIGREYFGGILLLIAAILMLFLLANFEGRRSAMTQEVFLIPSTYPQSVVLRVYGDTLVCVPFDRETNRIESSFFFIKLGNESNLRLTPQKVGPLEKN